MNVETSRTETEAGGGLHPLDLLGLISLLLPPSPASSQAFPLTPWPCRLVNAVAAESERIAGLRSCLWRREMTVVGKTAEHEVRIRSSEEDLPDQFDAAVFAVLAERTYAAAHQESADAKSAPSANEAAPDDLTPLVDLSQEPNPSFLLRLAVNTMPSAAKMKSAVRMSLTDIADDLGMPQTAETYASIVRSVHNLCGQTVFASSRVFHSLVGGRSRRVVQNEPDHPRSRRFYFSLISSVATPSEEELLLDDPDAIKDAGDVRVCWEGATYDALTSLRQIST